MFALLDETVAEAERIRGAVREKAQERRGQAREQALATVAQARLDAETLRTQTVAEARDVIASSRRHSSDEAQQRGQEIEHEGARTRDQDVSHVVAAVRDLVVRSARAAGSP